MGIRCREVRWAAALVVVAGMAGAWWVMAQSGQPKPFFPGTPMETDYAEIAQTIEDALSKAATAESHDFN